MYIEKIKEIVTRFIYRVKEVHEGWCLYTRCNELPLINFIRCACDGDLRALKKRGFVSRESSRGAWARVLEEYGKLSGNAKYEESFLLSRDIARENGKLSLIKACLAVLSVGYSRKCVDCLAGLGYKYKFPGNDIARFQDDLEKARKKARMIEVELKEKRGALERLFKGASRSSSREDFTRSLALLSRYMGYRIDPGKITVEEYVIMQKQHERETRSRKSLEDRKVS